MAWQQYNAFDPWGVLQAWPPQVLPVGNVSCNAQRNLRRRGGKGPPSKQVNSKAQTAAPHKGHQDEGAQPPGIWKKPSSGQIDHQQGGIRSEVLALRNARDGDARQLAVDNLRAALLTAAYTDEALDGMLLGMAAAQCAKHGLSELMGLICAYASCRLGNYGGREVAEMASAATKVGCAETGFLRAVVAFCASPSEGLFVSARDVGMAASALLHSQRQDNTKAFKGNREMRTSVDYAAGLLGIAEITLARKLYDGVPVRDLAELAHVFGHALDVVPVTGGQALHEQPAVRKLVRVTVEQLRLGIHLASARDATMTAGAIAAAWPHMEPEREAVFGPCLVDIVQLARFRRSDFNPQDLSLLALAFSKTDVATRDLIDVLNEQVAARSAEFSNKDLVLLLDSGARTEFWIHSSFVKTAAAAVAKCRLAEFSAQDLSLLAQSLAIVGAAGKEPLQRIAGEAFRRQLCSFSSKDKALLLWALAKARSKETALIRIAVRALGVEDCTSLDRETVTSTLWALARVWAQLPKGDPWPQSLLCGLCSTCPWKEATNSEVCNIAWALGQLALGQLPVPLETEVWSSFLASAEKLPCDACTVHELCCLLSGFSRSSPDNAVLRDSLADRFLVVMARKIESHSDTLRAGDARMLAEATKRTSWQLPFDVTESIKRSSFGKSAAGDAAADSDSQEDFKSTSDDHIATTSGEARSTSPTPPSSEGGGVQEAVQQAWPEHDQVTFERPRLLCGEHGQGHSCAECDGHGCGHGHGHGDGHSHGHTHQCQNGEEDQRSVCSPTINCSSAYTQAVAGAAKSGTVSGSTEELQEAVLAEGQVAHGLEGGQLCVSQCCPTILNSNDFGNVRLNAHCDFRGHCVQIKNTFLHISCGQSNESQGESECPVCKMTRSRSLDDLQARSGGAFDGVLQLPPGIGDASLSCKAGIQKQVRHRGGRGAFTYGRDDTTCGSPCRDKKCSSPCRGGWSLAGDTKPKREDSEELQGRGGLPRDGSIDTTRYDSRSSAASPDAVEEIN